MHDPWVKFRKKLLRSAEVYRIMTLTGMARGDTILALLELWCWCDGETDDGRLPHVSLRELALVFPADARSPGCGHDDLIARWVSALESVGWLRLGPDGARIPNFERHMGASEKRRAQHAKAEDRGRKRRRNNRPKVMPAEHDSVTPEKSAHGPQPGGSATAEDLATLKPAGAEKPAPENRRDVTSPTSRDKNVTQTCQAPSRSGHAIERDKDKYPPTPLSGGNAPPRSEDPEPPEGLPPPASAVSMREHVRVVSDDIELAARARALVKFYTATVRTSNIHGDPTVRVMNHLIDGRTEAEVRRAAERYASHCDRESPPRPPRMRLGAHSFFGPEGEFLRFLGDAGAEPPAEVWVPPPIVPPLKRKYTGTQQPGRRPPPGPAQASQSTQGGPTGL